MYVKFFTDYSSLLLSKIILSPLSTATWEAFASFLSEAQGPLESTDDGMMLVTPAGVAPCWEALTSLLCG